ncbi:diiron oxygenase [Streptomyces sp. NBC_00083]|uniref:AurF N-oxygenase family protein n=1 Tax=Streptomyces sp. NBC_00083 TaxID=2975647 RepID=UPI0022517F07|nr:diiron oxygenase [Streptomyces sp. NBC_00083]MCX5386977.1 diiron oxygenase [Streptomyces sp. NBC_00083]
MTAHLTRKAYDERLRTLSEGSVTVHFNAFTDIPWDDPEFAVDTSDPRWVLTSADALGAHPWYQEQSLETRIRIGIWRWAVIAKVGMQFENLLMRGALDYVYQLDNQDREFRYLTHEITEETHHTQMFQELVNRTGVDTAGGKRWFRRLSRVLPLLGSLYPEAFFTGILAGEEPIDHLQKAALRSGEAVHPLPQRIMQIHIAEEARHISFAHEFLRLRVPRFGRARRGALSVLFPVIMRSLCDVIMIPDRKSAAEVGIPAWVLKDVFWKSEAGRRTLHALFSDVRMLAEDIGLMNKASRPLWRALRIDGRPARFRGEPVPLTD